MGRGGKALFGLWGFGLALGCVLGCGRTQVFFDDDIAPVPLPDSGRLSIGCDLVISPSTLYFGWLPVGQQAVQAATLKNVGAGTCSIQAVALDPASDPSFAVDATQATSFSIGPRESATLTADFDLDNADPPNERTGAIDFQSDDPKHAFASVSLLASLSTAGSTCPDDHPNLFTGQTDQGGVCQTASDCTEGLTCTNSACWLLGEISPIQIVLSWDYAEDLDLHVVEPQAAGPDYESLPDGGEAPGCDIYYANGVEGGSDPDCTPVGSLNRDAQAACYAEDVNVEEVTYRPLSVPPPGWYSVRVDFWEDCDSDTQQSHPVIPYVVQVRIGTNLQSYCGQFTPDQADEGSEGSGTTVIQFQVLPDAGF